jgi:hypothetical protein
MRAIRSLADVQIVLKQLLDWQNLRDSKDWDFNGLRIKNASPSKDPSDYVVRSELHPTALAAPPVSSAPQTPAQVNNPPAPISTGETDQYYSIVFSVDNPTNGYETPPFVGGINRDGVFIDVWIAATGTPLVNPASINFNINGNPLLATDVQLPAGSNGPVHSSQLVSPLPVMGFDTRVTMKVNTASGLTLLSGGIVVRRNKNART